MANTDGKLTFEQWYYQTYHRSVYSGPVDPNAMQAYKAYLGSTSGYSDYLKQYQNGDMSAVDFQGLLANNGIEQTPEQTQWLNNQISLEAVQDERDYNTQMRDSSLTSAASQLSSLGLNPASVISTGGAGIGNTGAVADTSKGNPALEKAMADFQAKAAMTRTLVGLIGGLGSAGIIGGSRYLTQKAAAAAASSAANSGLSVIKNKSLYGGINSKNWDKKWSNMMYMFD